MRAVVYVSSLILSDIAKTKEKVTIRDNNRRNRNREGTKKTYQKGKKLVAIERSGSVDADIDVFGNAWGPAFKPRGRGADARRTVGGLIPRELLVASLTVCVRGSEPSRSWGKGL